MPGLRTAVRRGIDKPGVYFFRIIPCEVMDKVYRNDPSPALPKFRNLGRVVGDRVGLKSCPIAEVTQTMRNDEGFDRYKDEESHEEMTKKGKKQGENKVVFELKLKKNAVIKI